MIWVALALIVALLVAWAEARRQVHYLKAPVKYDHATWDPYLSGKLLPDGHRREYGQLYCGFLTCYLDWVDGDLVHTITQHHAPGCVEALMATKVGW